MQPAPPPDNRMLHHPDLAAGALWSDRGGGRAEPVRTALDFMIAGIVLILWIMFKLMIIITIRASAVP